MVGPPPRDRYGYNITRRTRSSWRHFRISRRKFRCTPAHVHARICTEDARTHTSVRDTSFRSRGDLNAGLLARARARTHARQARFTTHVRALNQLERIALPCRTRAQYALDHAVERRLFDAPVPRRRSRYAQLSEVRQTGLFR